MTLAGLLLAAIGGCWRTRSGAWIAPRRGPWGWFFRRRWRAVTIGEVIVYRDVAALLDEEVQRHEARHVEQYRRLGVFFLPVYLLLALLAVIMGRDHYRAIWLEWDARDAARRDAE